MFRRNNAADASGDAFVGNWINAGVQYLSLTVRHNHTTSLNFHSRLAATAGGGASLNALPDFVVPSNTWTTINIPITDSLVANAGADATFLSYGGGPSATFNGVFSNIHDLQFGFYVPASTTFTDLRMDVDNVSLVVPEPASLGLVPFAGAGLMLRRRAGWPEPILPIRKRSKSRQRDLLLFLWRGALRCGRAEMPDGAQERKRAQRRAPLRK